ncbi:MAG: exodeoxyribonuclease III [Proteobacteria bacterium]|nr:exodeoxyribonuclease III [Pseudomonadota bacterium]
MRSVSARTFSFEETPVVKVAAWNVNSIRARLPRVLDWLRQAAPDIVLLQETKAVAEQFPRLEIEDLGYNLAVVGQKTYNGVAILAKAPIEVVETALPGDPADDQARYLEAVVGGAGTRTLRVASLYLPNGNPVESEKFPYKLGWMERLCAHTRELLKGEEAFVLGGDYNLIPTDGDVYDPEGWKDDALCRPESRARFRAILYLGLVDAYRALNRKGGAYTFWDYQKGRWQRDEGLRIDHLLLSPQAADRLVAADIDKAVRGGEKASDHAPVWCALKD